MFVYGGVYKLACLTHACEFCSFSVLIFCGLVPNKTKPKNLVKLVTAAKRANILILQVNMKSFEFY